MHRILIGPAWLVSFNSSRLVGTLFAGSVLAAGWLTFGSQNSAIAAPAAAAADEKEKIPEPEDVDLQTSDGVELRATYYASTEGKDAVPVILLHGFKGDRREFDELALFLQQSGNAVIAPDLRGHGDSTKMVRPGSGAVVTLEASKLRKEDFSLMTEKDVETVKRFLMKKNNSGELNIEKLCVVGADMGATVALNWAALDWSWPPLATGKQGQDVKALVLISPQFSFKGIPITGAINVPAIRRDLSVMMIVGKGDPASMRDATRIHKALEKFRPAPPSDPKEAAEKQDLFFDKPSTSLSGTKMLGEKSLNLGPRIARFIDLRLVEKKIPWGDRSKGAAE